MTNPRNLSDVWASVVRKLSGDEVGVSFQPEMRRGLDATATDVARDVKANIERDADGRRVEREIHKQGDGNKDSSGCEGPRSPGEAFHKPGTGGSRTEHAV